MILPGGGGDTTGNSTVKLVRLTKTISSSFTQRAICENFALSLYKKGSGKVDEEYSYLEWDHYKSLESLK